MVKPLASLLFILSYFLFPFVDAEYIVCSGYINTLNGTQNVKFDLSKIRISLLYDGIRKESTLCNPDGSYMLSIEENDKRPFSLVPEGPTAATFDPPFQFIDPAKNISVCKSDINFVFLGFSVKGQVLSKYTSSGPKGLSVELLLSDKQASIRTTVTGNEGNYVFENVYPGKYQIRATNTMDYSFDKNSLILECEIGWESTETCSKGHIIVNGYSIKGNIDKSLRGIMIALYVKNEVVAKDLKDSEFNKELPKFEGYHFFSAREISSTVRILL